MHCGDSALQAPAVRRGAVCECQHGFLISMDVGLHVPALTICKSKFYHYLLVFPLESSLPPRETGGGGSCRVPRAKPGVTGGSLVHLTACVLWAHTFLRKCLTRTDPHGSSSRGSFSAFRAHWKLSCWGSPLILVLKTRKYRAQWAAQDNRLSCLSLLILLVFFLLFPRQAYSTLFFLPVSKFKLRWYLFCQNHH